MQIEISGCIQLQKNSKHNNHRLPSNTLCSTDSQSTFDSHSTAIRPRYDHSSTYVTTGLLQFGLNEQRGQRLSGYVTMILIDKQSNGRRIEVESWL